MRGSSHRSGSQGEQPSADNGIRTGLKEAPVLVAKGFCMGSADLVPGVSGGTVALILGIYTRLLEAIKSFDKVWFLAILRLDVGVMVGRPHFGFLTPLVVGIALAIIFFTKIIPLPVLLITHTEMLYGLFFGLILASIVVLMTEVGRFGPMDLIIVGAGLLVGFVIVTLVPVDTPNDAWFVFVAGAVAICAMVLPGISGSFILLILRKYSYVVGAVGELNLSVLLPFALGCITGLMLFTRLLVWMLHEFRKRTLLFIKGILIASLWVIWPFQDRTYELVRGKERVISTQPFVPTSVDATVVWSFVLLLVGFATVMAIHVFAQRRNLTE